MLFVGWGWHITNAEVIPALQLPDGPGASTAHAAAVRDRRRRHVVRAAAAQRPGLRRRAHAATAGAARSSACFSSCRRRSSSSAWRTATGTAAISTSTRSACSQFQPYPAGDFSWHHLWFIIYLYVYVLLLLPVMLWWRKARPKLRPGAWIYALALPLGLNEALLKPLFPETHNLVSDWYIFNHYLLLTLYGFVLASMPGIWDWLAQFRRTALLHRAHGHDRRTRPHRGRHRRARYGRRMRSSPTSSPGPGSWRSWATAAST